MISELCLVTSFKTLKFKNLASKASVNLKPNEAVVSKLS